MNDKDFLLDLIDYIEQVEIQKENEWGIGRSLDQLIADNAMPTIYAEAVAKLGEQNVDN